jgi:tetraacyldisaccharide 4'-kinase
VLSDPLRARLARRLEAERRGTTVERVLARSWQAIADRRLARSLALPAGIHVIGIGSAVLGGAGKTPVAIALARALALGGHEVALVSHAYQANPRAPRRVTARDAVDEVGDDALHAARELGTNNVSVVVAPSRQAALDHAARLGARVVVVDGLLQASPRRLAASILVVDERAPWGSGACPPLGDLRASPGALLAAADLVAVVGEQLPSGLPPGTVLATSRLGGAVDAAGRHHAVEALRHASVGLLLGVARPERVLRMLQAHGISPTATVLLGDHARFTISGINPSKLARVDAWLTTGRCATKLPAWLAGAPVLSLVHEVDVRLVAQRLLNRLER